MNHNLFSIKDLNKALLLLNKPIKKSLGQHYLINHQAAMTICQAVAKVSVSSRIVEIGAGLGHLTGILLANNFKVLAIETDGCSADFLKKRFKRDWSLFVNNGYVMHQDFLAEFELPDGFEKDLVLLGNLPYHITTPILFKSFEYFRECSSDLFFMMQKEVADRILADSGTKEYSRLSVLSRYHCQEIDNLMTLSPKSFYPSPKINSTVLHFKLRKEQLTKDYSLFKALVGGGFLYRRKQLKKALFLKNHLSLDKVILTKLRQREGDLLSKRAEELTLENYLYLTREYLKLMREIL